MAHITTLTKFQDLVDANQKIVFFGGAGVSTESGIPDFRSTVGLYSQAYDNMSAEAILAHTCFIKNPKLFYKFYFEKMIYPNVKPNRAHLQLAHWQTKKHVEIVTQNIDGLHQLAGSKIVWELHGSVLRNFCSKCQHFYSLEDIMKLKDVQQIPRCSKDGEIIKPDVVLYEEALNEKTISAAVEAIANCDLLIVGGTSLTVYPAAGLLQYLNRKAKLVLINKSQTMGHINPTLEFNDSVGEILSQIKV